MNRRIPVVATAVVALAVLAMLGLGCWQLFVRLPEKRAALSKFAANPGLPPVVFPQFPDEKLLFRRTRVTCADSRRVQLTGAGKAGFRAIAECPAPPGDATPLRIQIGTTHDPRQPVRWAGGTVTGYISLAPEGQPMLVRALRHGAPALMVVADRPAPGLAPNGAPDLSAVPNNHLAYAVQWFLFAGVAVVIYTIALRLRRRAARSPAAD